MDIYKISFYFSFLSVKFFCFGISVVLSGRKRSVSALFKWSEKAPSGCAPDLRRDTRNSRNFWILFLYQKNVKKIPRTGVQGTTDPQFLAQQNEWYENTRSGCALDLRGDKKFHRTLPQQDQPWQFLSIFLSEFHFCLIWSYLCRINIKFFHFIVCKGSTFYFENTIWHHCIFRYQHRTLGWYGAVFLKVVSW